MNTIEQKAKIKKKNWFKSIPWYGWFFGLIMIGFQTAFFYAARSFERDVSLHWIKFAFITPVDYYIPLVYGFVYLYISWYLFVPLGGVVAGRQKKNEWINFIIAWVAAIIIGALFLAFVPTYFDETHVPGIPGWDIRIYIKERMTQHNTLGWRFLFWCHNKPAGRGQTPSFHCLSIIFCYLGVARRKDVNIFHRLGQLLITILICISTVFTKQHYFVDIIMSIILCLICFGLTKVFDPGTKILKKCPNFLIIRKLNWTNEKIISIKKTKK